MNILSEVEYWGTSVAQLVKCLTLAQVMILWLVSSSSTSGSVLTAQSLEPALGSLSLSLSLSVCLSLSASPPFVPPWNRVHRILHCLHRPQGAPKSGSRTQAGHARSAGVFCLRSQDPGLLRTSCGGSGRMSGRVQADRNSVFLRTPCGRLGGRRAASTLTGARTPHDPLWGIWRDMGPRPR